MIVNLKRIDGFTCCTKSKGRSRMRTEKEIKDRSEITIIECKCGYKIEYYYIGCHDCDEYYIICPKCKELIKL